MATFSLKRLLAKKDVQLILHQLVTAIATPIAIEDAQGQILWSDRDAPRSAQHAITVMGEPIGWVFGDGAASAIAQLISHLATQESDKKALAQETLDRYKEIALLYDLSEKITTNLDFQSVTYLVLQEAQKLVQGDSGTVLLLNLDSQKFEAAGSIGPGFRTEKSALGAMGALEMPHSQEILRTVLVSGNGEIVNDVVADGRGRDLRLRSLMVAPLKREERVIGFIVMGNTTPLQYTAADLRRLNTLAFQAAAALENALLHDYKLREERIKSNLERYVPSQVVQAILKSQGEISLAPTRQAITILFSDIRGFTTQCEALPAETIVNYLNEYFTHMVAEIFDHQGTVNKFVGDMIVALFGAPFALAESEKCAIAAAIAMQKRIQVIPTHWIREHFHTGIGISSGKVIVGNIGSPQHMDYTAIGDEVNTASRLQSLAKGGQILVSRNVYELTRHDFQFREMGAMTMKGKQNTVDVFEVLY